MTLRHLKGVDEEDDDPMLSAINLVDVFLVLVVALMIAVSAVHPGAPLADIQGVGEIVVREGEREVRLKGTGTQGEGEGVRAGVAYRLRDGSIVYVPEQASAASGEPAR